MRIISTKDAVFQKIEESLGSQQEQTQLETLAGIDCDEEDLQNQRELGDEDPIVTIELIAQWLPEPPEIEHGGPLLAFNTQGQAPDLDILIEDAVKSLNEAVAWAEFELDEEQD